MYTKKISLIAFLLIFTTFAHQNVKATEECGRIQFESPVEFQTYTEIKSYTEEFKNSNNYFHTYYFLPTEGRMLLFPSHLKHEVFENKSNEFRV